MSEAMQKRQSAGIYLGLASLFLVCIKWRWLGMGGRAREMNVKETRVVIAKSSFIGGDI